MVLKQQGAAWGAVQVWLPDEQETDVLAGTLDHIIVTYGMFSDVETYARRRGLVWAVRPETQCSILARMARPAPSTPT